MNLLYLAHRIPFPPNKGDKIRSNALLQHLAARHRVFLGCFVDDDADFQYRPAVEAIVAGSCLLPLPKRTKLTRAAGGLLSGQSFTASVYGSRALQRWVDRVLAEQAIDAAIVFSSSMAPYLMGRGIAKATLFDMVDVDSDKWRQYAKTATPGLAQLYAREAYKLLALERAAASAFALTYLVSPYEADSFAALAPGARARIRALSNGVDLDFFRPGGFPTPFPAGVTPIVMTGRMDYWPNVDGATWFAQTVMPLLKAKIANAHFYVVGAGAAKSLGALAGADVTVTGEVADMRPYIAHAAAAVAPLRIARGVQNKVLEAMAMAKPTVATTAASRALNVQSGEHLYIADEPQAFAEAVAMAALDAGRDRIAANGRDYVAQNHEWDNGAGPSGYRSGNFAPRCARAGGTGRPRPAPQQSAERMSDGAIHPVPEKILGSEAAAAWTWHLGALALSLALLGLLFASDIQAAASVWWVYPAYSHCFLILPISAWLIWEKRDALKCEVPSSSPLLLLAALPVLLFWALGKFASITEARQFAMIGFVEIFIAAILGWAVFRKIAFACLYLVFLVPTGQYLIPYLQDITAKFVEVGLNALSIPFYREGTVFDLVNGRYEIAEACAGLRFLVATVALGVLYAHLSFRKTRKILIFLAACFIVPVIGNGIRALLTVMVANYTNNKVAVGFDHIVYGWVFAVCIIMLLLYIGSKYADPETAHAAVPASSTARSRSTALASAAGGVTLTLVLLLAISKYAAADTGTVDARNLQSALAGTGWTETAPSPEWHVQFSQPSGALASAFAPAAGGAPVDIDIHYYDRGARSASMLASLNFSWQDRIWHPISHQTVRTQAGASPVAMDETIIAAGNIKRLVWTGYWIDGSFVAASPLVRLLEFRSGVMHGHSAIIALSTAIDGPEDQARARLTQFLASRANLAAGLARAGAAAAD